MLETPQPAYLNKARREVWVNFSVLRHGKFDGFLVTSKNSGTHWLKYMLAIALAETYGVERPRYFSENAVRPYISWSKDPPVYPQLPRLGFSHTIPHRLADWSWAHSLAQLPPYVLCVRHPMEILASHYAKWAYELQVDWLEYLRGDPDGSRYRCDIFWIARFWNRWGDLEQRFPERILRVQYEALKANPRTCLQEVAAHWGICLSPDAIECALQEGTKEAMARRVDPQAEPNVLQNRPHNLADLFSGEAMEIYSDHAGRLFRHDLGYDLRSLPVSHNR